MACSTPMGFPPHSIIGAPANSRDKSAYPIRLGIEVRIGLGVGAVDDPVGGKRHPHDPAGGRHADRIGFKHRQGSKEFGAEDRAEIHWLARNPAQRRNRLGDEAEQWIEFGRDRHRSRDGKHELQLLLRKRRNRVGR